MISSIGSQIAASTQSVTRNTSTERTTESAKTENTGQSTENTPLNETNDAIDTSAIKALTEAQKPQDPPSSVLDSELTPEEEKVVQELKQRDAEVRAHEQAHKNVGGPVTGAITYQFETGPDGRQYAVSGEVDIDVSPENDPEDTIRKMDVVIRAALAPAEPSPQDRAVAAQARQIQQQARQELQEQRTQEQDENTQNASSSIIQQLIEESQNPQARNESNTPAQSRQAANNLTKSENLSAQPQTSTLFETA